MLHDLPEPVSRYLRYTGVVGQPIVRTVHLRQKATMRPGAGRRWLPSTWRSTTRWSRPVSSGRARCAWARSRSGVRVTCTSAAGAHVGHGRLAVHRGRCEGCGRRARCDPERADPGSAGSSSERSAEPPSHSSYASITTRSSRNEWRPTFRAVPGRLSAGQGSRTRPSGMRRRSV
jgi:hypothetical protein